MHSTLSPAQSWLAPVARAVVLRDGERETAEPELRFIDAGLRRRLSPLSRLALQAARACAGDLRPLRIVFASRHGDLSRTTALLLDLAAEEELSPTTFSMSVLNASAGVYSIAQKDRAPSTAIAAGAASLGWGLLEASLQFAACAATPVLLIYADGPVAPLHGPVGVDVPVTSALALLLAPNAPHQLRCEVRQSDEPASQQSQFNALAACLTPMAGKYPPSTWHGEGKSWSWEMRST